MVAKKDSGSPTLHYAGPMGPDSAFELSYKTLWDAISKRGHLATDSDAQHLNIALGPHGSYYCTTKYEPIWRDIPADLQSSIAESAASPSAKKPRQVALGMHDTWVCIWSDHSHTHNLGSHYPGLAANLNQKTQDTKNRDDDGSSLVAFVALNPWRTDSWLLADCGGTIVWENAPADTADRSEAEAVRDVARDYMQRRARRTGSHFTTSFTFGDGGREAVAAMSRIAITPQTRHDDPPTATAAMVGRLRRLQDRVPLRFSRADAVAGELRSGRRRLSAGWRVRRWGRR
ncbi:hypothetical protein PG997_002741 [Apiospora hydei]|uniref:Uncharacterized protein n=1 Tax=Apiospora hydei TaxID=1337664 RepID=A0ABR1WXA7_9PEZI